MTVLSDDQWDSTMHCHVDIDFKQNQGPGYCSWNLCEFVLVIWKNMETSFNKLGVFYQVLQYSSVHSHNAPILTFLVSKLYGHVIIILLSCLHQSIPKKYF